MAKKETLLSKEDAAEMFLLSKDQWNDNVLRAHKQGVARAVSSPSGIYKMGFAYPEGYHMVVTPTYHRGDEKPSYLQVYVIYPPALQEDFTEEIIEQVKETAIQEMRPQFSVTASHEITDLGLGFIFFIEDAR